MPEAVLAVDAGTTSVRALVVAADGSVLAKAGEPFGISYPRPGWVEQDAEAIWQTTLRTAQRAVRESGVAPRDLRALGITSQRSTVIVWERATGRPVHAALSWQDLRGARRADELAAEGFIVVALSSAPKLEWVIDHLDRGRERMHAGELAWGTPDTYLVARFSGGTVHATDASHASCTAYYSGKTGTWDEQLIAFQGLEKSMFADIVDSAGVVGVAAREHFGTEVPIAALIGDQQAAAYAEGATARGLNKITYGTSAMCDACTGDEIMGVTAGAFPLVLWRRDGRATYCLECHVSTVGAVFDWLAGGLGLVASVPETAALAASVPDSHGVFMLPALQGLGSPYMNPTRHALIGGLTRGTRPAHIVRAAMEGVAFRVREMLDALYAESGLPRPDVLRVDGGASANDVLMQIQADVLGQPVERMDPIEATAMGVALLAGEGAGVWDAERAHGLRRVDRTFEPAWSADERDARFTAWRAACGLDTR